MKTKFYWVSVTFVEGGDWHAFRMRDAELTFAFGTGSFKGKRIFAIRTGDLVYDFLLKSYDYNPWRLAPNAKNKLYPLSVVGDADVVRRNSIKLIAESERFFLDKLPGSATGRFR